MHQQRLVDQPGHRRAGLVGDANGVSAAGARRVEHVVDVFALARLRHADDQRAVQSQLRTVERVDRRRGQRHGDAGRQL